MICPGTARPQVRFAMLDVAPRTPLLNTRTGPVKVLGVVGSGFKSARPRTMLTEPTLLGPLMMFLLTRMLWVVPVALSNVSVLLLLIWISLPAAVAVVFAP